MGREELNEALKKLEGFFFACIPLVLKNSQGYCQALPNYLSEKTGYP